MQSNRSTSDRGNLRAKLLLSIGAYSIRSDRRYFSKSKYAHHGRQVAPRERDITRKASRADKRTANPFIVSDNWIDSWDLIWGDVFGPSDEERYPQYAAYMQEGA